MNISIENVDHGVTATNLVANEPLGTGNAAVAGPPDDFRLQINLDML